MEQTVNLFQKGLLTDFHPLILSNDTLIDALNATITTLNGNEMILQNDMGNVRVEKAFLRPGYVPVGIKEYGGIIYVASYNPITNKSLIGSFPSPERDINGADDPNLGYLGFSFDNIISHSEVEALLNLDCVDNTEILLPLSKNNSLRAGDKFIAYTTDYFFSEIVGGLVKDTSEDYITNYDNLIYDVLPQEMWDDITSRDPIDPAEVEQFLRKYNNDDWFIKKIREITGKVIFVPTDILLAIITLCTSRRSELDARAEDILNNPEYYFNYKIKTPKNKLYTLSLGILNSQNEFVDITKSLVRWNTNLIENKESIESAILDTSKLSDLLKFNYGYFMPVINPNINNPMEFDHLDAAFIENRQTVPANTYAYKLIGPLYLKAQLNHIETIRHNFYGEYNNGNGELIIESTIVYNCPDGIKQSDWKPYTPNFSDIYSELEIPEEKSYNTVIEIEGEEESVPTDLYYNILQERTNNGETSLQVISPTSVTIDKSIFTDNLYKVIITKTYDLGSEGITVNENIARFVIGVNSNFKYEDNNVDKDTYIEELSELKEIDVTKLNSGNLELKNWRFLNNWDGESTDSNAEISMYFEAYPKKNHSFRNIRLDFYEAPETPEYNGFICYDSRLTESYIRTILPLPTFYGKYIKTYDNKILEIISSRNHYNEVTESMLITEYNESDTYGYTVKRAYFRPESSNIMGNVVGTLNIETDEIYSNTLISQSFNWESLNLKPRTVYYVDVIYDDFDANTLTSTDKHQDAWYLASNLLDECYYKDSENFILNFNDLTDNKLLSYLEQDVAIETSYSIDENNEYHDSQLSTYSVFTNKYNNVKVEYHKKFLVNCHYDIGKQLLLKFPEGLNVNSGNYAPASFKMYSTEEEEDISAFSTSYSTFINNISSEISGSISSQFKYEDDNKLSIKGFNLLVGGYFYMILSVSGYLLSNNCPIAIESFSDFYNSYITGLDLDIDSTTKKGLFGISRNEGGIYLTRNDDDPNSTYVDPTNPTGEEIMIQSYTPTDNYMKLNLEIHQSIQNALSDGFSNLYFIPNKKLFMIGCAKGNIPGSIISLSEKENSRLFRVWMKTGDKSEPQWALLASLWIENESDINTTITRLKALVSEFVSKYNFEYSFRTNVTSNNYYTKHKFIKAFKEYFKLNTLFKVTTNRNNNSIISETKSFLLKNRIITFTLNYNNFTEYKSFDVEFKTSDYYNNRVEILNLINNGDTSILINSRGEVWDLDGNPLELNKIYNTCNVSILPKQFDTVDGVKIPLYSYKQESGSIKICLTTSGSTSSDLVYNGNPVIDRMTVEDTGLYKVNSNAGLTPNYILSTRDYPFYIVDAPFNPTW